MAKIGDTTKGGSAEIVNLRQARKAKKRREAEVQAAENRVRFGRPGAERKRDAAEKELETRRLDGHRLDRDDDQG